MLVYEVIRGTNVLKVVRTRKAARRWVDRLDLEYGSACHWIRETHYY